MRTWFSAIVTTAATVLAVSHAAAQDDSAAIAETLRTLDSRVINDDKAAAAAREAVRLEVRARLKMANARQSAAWYAVKSSADWEAMRDVRLAALNKSLTLDPLPTEPRNIRTTRTIDGENFRIENITFESRPGVVVTANLYAPVLHLAKPMPGIVIVHSHHAPKTQSELQDMGTTFARQGATVLVMDQLGHGERRTHKFGVTGQYAGDYQPSRQDYYFRYNTGVQLSLVGESLMGWMVGDIMCGATLLARRPEVDPKKLILIGAVAGGGDPTGVAGALDRRFAAVVPFNYGGYEPEDVFPLPDDAELSFNYSGSGSWESTRNLRLSARDGFMPWVVVGSIAPRAVVYAHEFRWDEPRDPVWKRLRAIYGHYAAADRLSSAHGSGTVRGKSVEDSHCTNIGPIHRAQLYPEFHRWFGLPVPPAEYKQRRATEELMCLSEPKPFSLHEVLQKIAAERLAAARERRASLNRTDLRDALRTELAPLLGAAEPSDIGVETEASQTIGDVTIERIGIGAKESGVMVPLPMLMLRRNTTANSPAPPVIVMVAQGGKEQLLKQRADVIAALLAKGAVVVLPDLRGTGETMPSGEGRGRTSGSTSRSSSEQMLGETMLGRRLSDLLNVLNYVRTRDEWKSSRISLYGDGLVAANLPNLNAAAPLDAANLPDNAEPLGAIVCLLAALWDDSITAVYAGGGPTSFASILDEPYFYVPHDVILPGVLAHADIADLLAAQTAQVYLADCRDGANRPATAAHREQLLADYRRITDDDEARGRLSVAATSTSPNSLAVWLLRDFDPH